MFAIDPGTPVENPAGDAAPRFPEAPAIGPERSPARSGWSTARMPTKRKRSARWISRRRGQTLVEFALILPLFMIFLMGVIEFAFLFNATLAVNFASRNASLVAAEAGSNTLADCAILAKIEDDIGPPLDKSGIRSVTIYKADRAGNAVATTQNAYKRTSSSDCTGYIPSTVPYEFDTLAPNYNTYRVGGYGSVGDRCDILAGCPTSLPVVPMDSIGVRIVYRYVFHTPLRNLVSFLPGASSGYLDVTWSNVMRMEPIL